jgi:hypothetical protein
MAHSLEVRVPLVNVALLGRVVLAIHNFKRLRTAPPKTGLTHSPSKPLPDQVVQRSKTVSLRQYRVGCVPVHCKRREQLQHRAKCL